MTCPRNAAVTYTNNPISFFLYCDNCSETQTGSSYAGRGCTSLRIVRSASDTDTKGYGDSRCLAWAEIGRHERRGRTTFRSVLNNLPVRLTRQPWVLRQHAARLRNGVPVVVVVTVRVSVVVKVLMRARPHRAWRAYGPLDGDRRRLRCELRCGLRLGRDWGHGRAHAFGGQGFVHALPAASTDELDGMIHDARL